VANDGEQDRGGALATVVEQRRKRGRELKSRRALGQAARPRGVTGVRGRGVTWRLRAAAVRRGWAGKTPAGSGERGRASWRPGGAGRAARGQLAAREIAGEGAMSGAAVKQRGERKTMRTYP
jgi:hypothetical protein